jgi:hypothetical protein
MAKNKISNLRDHLFETLERLKDEENPMEVQRALAISTVAGTIIESAKAEIKFMEATGEQVDTNFFGQMPADRQPRLVAGRPDRA